MKTDHNHLRHCRAGNTNHAPTGSPNALSILATDDEDAEEKLRSGEAGVDAAFEKIHIAETLEARRRVNVKLSKRNRAFPPAERRYSVLLADPPWQYDHPVTETGAGEKRYPTMTVDDICALPVETLATDDAVLFLLAPLPLQPAALKVISAWGFDCRMFSVRPKDLIGMGDDVRQQPQVVFVAARGTLPMPEPPDRHASQTGAPRGKHSTMLVEVYDLLEQMYPHAAKIALFARARREGWDRWGNQASSWSRRAPTA